jgi:NAD(P)-dependent dehydrogenase (short-subunit alcohol dehydrogenase family)
MGIKKATVAACTGTVGRSLVEILTNNGAKVVGFCRVGSASKVEDLKISANGLFEVIEGDMTTTDGSKLLVSRALEILDGTITAHFHAAGSFNWISWSQLSPKEMDSLWISNFQTAWMVGQEVFKTMSKKKHGSLIFVSNRDTQTFASSGFGPYLSSKAALNMFVQSLAAEGKNTGVRVNAVLPTIIDTEINRRAMPDQNHHNWVNPSQLANLMIQLSNPSLTDLSGALIPVNARML